MMGRGGGGRGGRGQGGPNTYGRGAFRGGRGSGRPTPKPVFAQYSDLTVPSSEKSHEKGADESGIIPFNIASPDILRVKGGEGHQSKQ